LGRAFKLALVEGGGLLIGFAGVYFLMDGGAVQAGGDGNQLFGMILVIAAGLCWATGSIYGVRAPTSKSPILASGMQMLAGGSAMLLVGTLMGEWTGFEIGVVSRNSWFAFAYLLVFGSLIGFTAYSWLLKNARPAIVATYAYVNPVIAVMLGWAIAGESFTGRTLLGAGVIVGSVAMITSQNSEVIVEEKAVSVSIEGPTEDCPTYLT
jgi:drug/metabolite transporter (DMT)-like permease